MTALDLRFGGYQPPSSIHNRAAAYFGDVLRNHLGDRAHFELIGNVLDLGRPSSDLPKMVESGELAFSYVTSVRMIEAVPDLTVLQLPFVVRNRPALQSALAADLGDRFARRMKMVTPYRLLGVWDNGFRHFTNRLRPIRAPEHCAGMRIRTQLSDLQGEALAALGFTPIATDVKTFVEELSGDLFDAQENPLTNSHNFGVFDHHRHVTLSAHFFGATVMICAEAAYRTWAADIRAAVDTAAREATAFQHRLALTADDEVLAQIDPTKNAVVHLDPNERARFESAMRPVLEKCRRHIDPSLFRYLQ